MKTTKIFLIATLGAVLASCGSKSGGKPNFADNEYAVRTVEAQGTEMQTSYPATIKGIQDVQIRPKVSGFITKICVHEDRPLVPVSCSSSSTTRPIRHRCVRPRLQ